MQTPLSAAVMENQTEVAKLLIDSGADAHTVDGNGHTPLHKATMRVRILLSCGPGLITQGQDSYSGVCFN